MQRIHLHSAFAHLVLGASSGRLATAGWEGLARAARQGVTQQSNSAQTHCAQGAIGHAVFRALTGDTAISAAPAPNAVIAPLTFNWGDCESSQPTGPATDTHGRSSPLKLALSHSLGRLIAPALALQRISISSTAPSAMTVPSDGSAAAPPPPPSGLWARFKAAGAHEHAA